MSAWMIRFFFTLGAAVVFLSSFFVVRAWKRISKSKAARAFVYDRNADTDPVLTPERLKLRIPRPEDIGEPDDLN